MIMGMTPLIYLSLITSLMILLSIIYIAFDVYTFIIKKFTLFSISLFVTLLLVFLVQIFALTIDGNESGFIKWFDSIYLFVYLIILSLVVIGIPLFFIYLIKYKNTHITSNSIIKAFNTSKEGFLYFEKDGTCLLTNKKMEEISKSLTKRFILNGYDFLALVKDKTITLDSGETYQFIFKEIKHGNKRNCR